MYVSAANILKVEYRFRASMGGWEVEGGGCRKKILYFITQFILVERLSVKHLSSISENLFLENFPLIYRQK